MTALVRLNIDNARRAHHVAVWAANQNRKFPCALYRAMAIKLRREAYEFLDDARRAKRLAA